MTSPQSPQGSPQDASWVQISHETLNELRRQTDERAMYQTSVGMPSPAALHGYPVHFVDGKWYVEVRPSLGNWVEGRLHIQEVIEHHGVGTYIYEADRDRVQIWDGNRWFATEGSELAQLGIKVGESPFPEGVVERIKAWMLERDEEQERLELRQLLAERQKDGSDGGLP